jgi:hypothetical protein
MTAEHDHDRERSKIRAAAQQLIVGTPLRSDGALTVVSLAIEAGVKRHVLTHRHTDLKDEFYARIRAIGRVPESERTLREELEQAKRGLRTARERIRELEVDLDGFARVVNVLSIKNERLRVDAPQVRHLTPMLAVRGESPEQGNNDARSRTVWSHALGVVMGAS